MSSLREAAQQALLAWNTVCGAQGWDPMHLQQFVRLRESLAQTDDKAQPVMLEHVAVAEDGGKLRWLTARRPRDCELYALPYGINTPPRLYATPQPPAEQPFQPDWMNYKQGLEDGKAEAEQEPKRPENCGTNYCSCIECPFEQGAELSDEQIRDGFERWMKKQRTQTLERYGDTYRNAHVRCRWEGWKAAMLDMADRAARGGAA